jgi:predicted DCC family thiol-disulfide oxidoreductase YuxK
MIAAPAADEHHAVILFDGVCNFCCWSVQFIIARDPKEYFRFASQQSEIGQSMLANAGLPAGTADTFVLVENKATFTRSAAALKVAGRLRWPWPLCGAFWVLPQRIRDWAYRLVARNRYRWFGQKDTCWVPGPDIARRFLA